MRRYCIRQPIRRQLANILWPKYAVRENIAPPQTEGRQKRIWDEFPAKVNDKILKYLTPTELVELKDVLMKSKEFIEENKVLCFNKTLECLDKIIKGITKGCNNNVESEFKFVTKNRVRFEGSGGEGGRGYIVRTTKRFVYVVLEKDLYKAKQDIKFVRSHKVKHMSPFMGEETNDVD